MRTKLLILGGLVAVGAVIHHSGHCPLMEAKKALSRQANHAPAPVTSTAAVMPAETTAPAVGSR